MKGAHYYNSRTPYEKISRGRYEAIKGLISKNGHKTILDIGCGSGSLGARLKKDGIINAAYGLDVSADAVSTAGKILDGAWVFDAEKSKLPKEVPVEDIDLIIVSEVLEHLFDPEDFLKKVRKNIDLPIIVTVPNILFWKNRLNLLRGSFEYKKSGIMDWGHIRFFTSQTLKETLVRAGYFIGGKSHVVPTKGTSFLSTFFPNLFSRQFVFYAEPVEVVVYTAIFGGYDTLAPVKKEKGVSFICVTDNEEYKVRGWTTQYMESMYEDSVRNARFAKVNPHLLFPHVKKSVWIDGNISVRSSIKKALKKHLPSGTSMAVYDHGSTAADPRNSLFEEAEVLISSGKKDDPSVMESQINRYKEEGYVDDQGLISSMVVFRDHSNRKVISGMNLWWEEIEKGSRRDQLSFNYAMWKKKVPFVYINEDSRNNKFFKHVPHKKRS